MSASPRGCSHKIISQNAHQSEAWNIFPTLPHPPPRIIIIYTHPPRPRPRLTQYFLHLTLPPHPMVHSLLSYVSPQSCTIFYRHVETYRDAPAATWLANSPGCEKGQFNPISIFFTI